MKKTRSISGESVRSMLGLADRGRVLDLFEKILGGRIAEALTDLADLYDQGADPLAVMQDLLETTHFLTRVKVAPGAEGFFDGGSGEAKRAAEMAAKLSVPMLTRAWQMLLKGLFEVKDAARPIVAAEMALIRLAYAADLPPTENCSSASCWTRVQPNPVVRGPLRPHRPRRERRRHRHPLRSRARRPSARPLSTWRRQPARLCARWKTSRHSPQRRAQPCSR